MQHNGIELQSMTYNGNEVLEWLHNGISVFQTEKYLYSGISNEGNFKAFAGGFVSGYYAKLPTLTVGNELTVANTSNLYAKMSAVSDAVDISAYKYLRFSHISSSPNYANAQQGVYVGLVRELSETMTADKQVTLLNNRKGTTRGDIEIDISDLKGKYYVDIMLTSASASAPSITINTQISNMVLSAK